MIYEENINPNVAVLDSSKRYLNLCQAWHERGHSQVINFMLTQSKIEMMSWIDEGVVDVAVVDLGHSDCGISIAKEIRNKYPNVIVFLNVKDLSKSYERLKDGIKCLQKVKDIKLLATSVLSEWLRLTQKRKEVQLQLQDKIEEKYPCSKLIEPIGWTLKSGVAAMDYRLIRSGGKFNLRCKACRHPNNTERLYLLLGVQSKCVYGCKMCGMCDCDIPFFNLTAFEMLAQTFHLLSCSLAIGYSEIRISLPERGDFIGNPKEVCDYIKLLYEAIGGLVKLSFIIPTIGDTDVFEKYLLGYGLYNYPVQIRLSCHSLSPTLRSQLIPYSKGQDLRKTRNILTFFANRVGMKWPELKSFKLGWAVAKNFNDSFDDLDDITKYCAGWPVKVRVMIMEGGFDGYQEVTKKEAEIFSKLIRKRGIDSKFSVTLGVGFNKRRSLGMGRTYTAHEISTLPAVGM